MAKIMIVDDESDVQLALSLTLEESGYDTLAISNGAEALALVREVQPDLILLDINMPEMDGYQVLEQLKAFRDTAAIPVMMISARTRPRDREDALFMGAVDYITKPWSEGELELRVCWAISRSASMAEAGLKRDLAGAQAA